MGQILNAIITTSLISFLPEWYIIKRVFNINKKNLDLFLVEDDMLAPEIYVRNWLVNGCTLAETCSHSTLQLANIAQYCTCQYNRCLNRISDLQSLMFLDNIAECITKVNSVNIQEKVHTPTLQNKSDHKE